MIILILYRDTHNGISTWSNTIFHQMMLLEKYALIHMTLKSIVYKLHRKVNVNLHHLLAAHTEQKRVKTKVILAVYFRFLTHMYVHRLQYNEGWSMIGIISCSYKYTGNPSVKKRLFFCVIIDPIFLFKSEENYQKFLIFWGKAKVFFFR